MKIKRILAVVLSSLLLVSALFGCTGKNEESSSTPKYQEALELMKYLEVFTEGETKKFDRPLTGAVAGRALQKLDVETTISETQETVKGGEFVLQLLDRLGYHNLSVTAGVEKANGIFMTRGFLDFDPEKELTVEEAANLMMGALLCDIVNARGESTGTRFCEYFDLRHEMDTEYEEPFNRPGSCWINTKENVAVTAEYPALPVAVFGTTASYCDIMVALGYAKDDPENYSYIPKYFQLCIDGSKWSEQFWKAHDTNDHAICSNDFTGGQDATLELFQISDYQYRMVIQNTFLGVSDGTQITLYGFERSEYGPYTDEKVPPKGVYICHNYWNAYGLGSGYEVTEPARVIHGKLGGGNVLKTIIDGVEYENAQSYGYGKKLSTAPVNTGKEFYFYLDRYGFMLGCSQEPVE